MAGALLEERRQIVEYLVEYLAAAGSAQEVEEAQLLEQQLRGWAAAVKGVPPSATQLK